MAGAKQWGKYMNLIVRMMKRYIKTPLKYALPLLFIGALVLVSISGCTSSTTQNANSSGSSGNIGVKVDLADDSGSDQ